MRRWCVLRALLMLIILAAPLAWAPAAVADGETVHKVRWGETLTRIARQYNVTLEALLEANDLERSSVIYVGQELRIPPLPEPVVIHVVQPCDSLLTISHQYGVSVNEIARRNLIFNIDLLFVGQRLVIPNAQTPTGRPTPSPTTTAPTTTTPAAPTPTATPTAPAASPTPTAASGAPQVQEAIVVTSPAAGEVVRGGRVTLAGWGSGFENTLAVDILDEAGRRIGQGIVIVAPEADGYGPFEGEVTYAAPSRAQEGRVQVYSISARDGAIEHLTSVSIRLQP